MAIPPDKIPEAAFQVFARTILSQLMVERCMEADDPVADAESRAAISLGAGDSMLDKRGGEDALSHHVLHHQESFWASVRDEVATRVRLREAR